MRTSTRIAAIASGLTGLAIGAALIGGIGAADVNAPTVTPDAVSETQIPAPVTPTPETVTPAPETVTPAEPEESATTPTPSSNWTPPDAPVTTLPAPVETPGAGLPPQTKVCAPWMEPGWIGADGQAMSCIWAMPNTGGTLELKACATEDSENCFWDATIRGNGQGRSFINIRGHIFFEEVTP